MAGEIFITGHSLGAARAALYAFSRIKRGLRVDGLFLFGSPNPGDGKIGNALAGLPTLFSIKNGRDLVTDVPVDLKYLNEEYVQVAQFLEIDQVPPRDDEWGPFRYHHAELYQAGCSHLHPMGVVSIQDAINWVVALYNMAEGFDWLNITDGAYWGRHTFENGAKLMIARGSTTVLDWLDDFSAFQVPLFDARVSAGFWAGVERCQAQLDGALDA